MRESLIEKQVCDYARKHGWLVYKFTSPQHRGVPDRIFVSPRGVVVWMEFKAPGKKPTPLQARELAKLTERGCYAGWTDNAETAIAHLQVFHK